MLRLSPARGLSLEQATELEVFVGGAESNVAVTLSRLGVRAGWISRLVDDPLGRRIAAAIRGQGVDTSAVIWTAAGRTGLYFLEPGVPPRNGRVIYDRRDSAAAGLRPEDVNWAYLRASRLLHLTGITPALSASCLSTVRRAIAEARATGIRISFDVNYRAKLWPAAHAADALRGLVEGIDLLICPHRDARSVFDASADPERAVAELARMLATRVTVLTVGEEGALALSDGQHFRQPAVPAEPLDPVGRGDAFSAGLIYGYLRGDLALGLRVGVRLAGLSQTYCGDVGWATAEDLTDPEGEPATSDADPHSAAHLR